MDLTTIAAALLVAFGLITADAVMSANNLVVEVVAPPRSDKVSIDEATLERTFFNQLHAVAQTRSLVDPPEIRTSKRQGIGMALAEAVRVQSVAHALQAELGYDPDRLRLALFMQNSSLHALLSGNGHGQRGFEHVLTARDDETLPVFVRRVALFGSSLLAPYATALYLVQVHSSDKDFSNVLALVEQAKSKLPPTPVNRQRSLYENIRGIVELFRDDTKAAKAAFAKAVADDPSNPVAILNLAFAEIQLDEYQAAADRMEVMLRDARPDNVVLHASCYMTWAAANIGLHDYARADALMAKSLEINPTSSTAYDLWADLKEQLGQRDEAARLKYKSQAETGNQFENYAEVAALYFHLAWENGMPVTRSKFVNTGVITFQ